MTALPRDIFIPLEKQLCVSNGLRHVIGAHVQIPGQMLLGRLKLAGSIVLLIKV